MTDAAGEDGGGEGPRVENARTTALGYVARRKRRRALRKTSAGFLPIPVLILFTAAVYFSVRPSAYYDPAWLILFGNTIFIGAVLSRSPGSPAKPAAIRELRSAIRRALGTG
jgi:hypothetical protein